MKTLRIVFGVIAFAFAMTGAFAAKFVVDPMGHQFVSGPPANSCQAVERCNNLGDIECKSGSVTLYSSSVIINGTTCGNALKRQ